MDVGAKGSYGAALKADEAWKKAPALQQLNDARNATGKALNDARNAKLKSTPAVVEAEQELTKAKDELDALLK